MKKTAKFVVKWVNLEMGTITIIDYELKHQPFFEKFNRRWIEKYFVMEELDEFVLTNPEEAILVPGGAILMALYNEEVAGTAALRKIDETTYEFTKMAVEEKFQRKGIALALSLASFKKAEELGANEVILYTNSILKPAIALYEKLGFKHVHSGFKEYKRSDVKMSVTIKKTETVTL